jgi:hypothetical protein
VTAEDKTDCLLQQAWSALGGDPALLDLIEMTGDGTGLLPSMLAAMPAMTAAVAASTLAASVLDSTRRSKPPARVVVDREHIGVAARSEHYARTEIMEESDRFDPFAGFWRTSDGWFRVHGMYPWHRQRALKVLACEERHESVRQAMLAWRGDDLEDALTAVGGVGYVVRSEQQWKKHPQGRAVATLPLMQSETAAGPGRTAATNRGAAGLRVLDLTRVLAGPIGTRTLAAWGAEVLRIDSPHLPEMPTLALDTLPGKRSARLDLTRPAERARFEELLEIADVLVQGYRPGALTRYGLDAHELSERHPHLSVITVSAWGPSGPWATRRGFDSIVQCPTGIALAEGVEGRPGTLPAQVLDHATGYLAAAAGLLALAAVQLDEPPRLVQLSLAQTAQWLQSAGQTDPESPRRAEVDAYRVVLAGAAAPVQVISPPGRIDDLRPCWSFTTDLGTDAAQFGGAVVPEH